jgi:5-methyltetrahydropteroyltriglutamate--homocysteine methyltransferase
MQERFRADHLGSFLRPAELLQARAHAAQSPGSAQALAELHALEDVHIRRVVAKQQELGFPFATDGELRRNNFMSDFLDAVEGFDTADAVARNWQASGASGEVPQVSAITGVVTKKLRQHRRLAEHELDFLKAAARLPAKVTLPSATQFPAIAFKDGITDKVYKDRTALLWDIVEILKNEVAAVAAQGADYIQIDAPRYSYYLDPKWRDWIRKEMHRDPDAILAESLRADSECLKAARIPGTVGTADGKAPRLGFHLCRGNNRSQWYAEGGYDAIAERLFTMLDPDRWLLEYDDERSGTFEPLRFIPKRCTVVLGLVSSKRPQLEEQATLIRRIEAASKYVPLDRLALSPQCGFASTAEGNLLTEDQQWAKLKLVVDTAREVWK